MKKTSTSAQKLSKSEKKQKLFFMSKDKVIYMPLNGHWNNDTGCRPDLDI